MRSALVLPLLVVVGCPPPPPPPPPSVDPLGYCAAMADCFPGSVAADCVEVERQRLERGAARALVSPDEISDCDKFDAAHRALLTCVATEAAAADFECQDISNCTPELKAENDLLDVGAFNCFAEDVPFTLPDLWLCRGRHFNTGDGCDCGCGALDDDCDNGGCEGEDCAVEGCDVCYASFEDAANASYKECAP